MFKPVYTITPDGVKMHRVFEENADPFNINLAEQTYDPDALVIKPTHEVVGLNNVFGGRTHDSDGKLARATAAHERAKDLRDQGLPPYLGGPKQGM